MDETDADKKAEMPKDSRKVAGGTAREEGEGASNVHGGGGDIPNRKR